MGSVYSADRSPLHTSLLLDLQDGRGPLFVGNVDSPKIRLLVQIGDTFRPVCKLLLPRADLSFAIIPYSAKKQYYYHSATFGPGEMQKQFDCTDTSDFESIPKMQFHDALPGRSAGMVHISAGKTRVGAVAIPPLSTWTGDHIATVDIDRFSALPVHAPSLKREGDDLDQPLRFAEGVEAGRLVFCANARGPVFAQACLLIVRVWNESKEMFLGIAPKEHPPRGEPSGGIVVVGGWDPESSRDRMNLLTLRAL